MTAQEKFCQSCGMPLDESLFGTKAGGAPDDEFCLYCYKEGEFTSEVTMEEMIAMCVPHMVGPEMSAEKAEAMMRAYLPQLKRWKK